MKNRIGLIGLGHLGQFLVTGWAKADPDLRFFLANRSKGRAQAFAEQHSSFFSIHNQEIVDRSDIVILATRPEQVSDTLNNIEFKAGQIVVSVAAGVALGTLGPMVQPAKAVRALPVSCVAINRSPVIVYPDDRHVEALFSLVGQVHLLKDEASFPPGTALVGAFYAWMFLLMEEAFNWTVRKGIEPEMARQLVIETIEGACATAADQPDTSMEDIWTRLATPGGISEHGARILSRGEGLKTWSDALEAISQRMLDSMNQ